MKLRIIVTAAVSLLLVGGICDRETEVPDPQWQPGFFRPIGGREFNLPNGLVVENIYGYGEDLEDPYNEDPLAMVINNTTNSTITTTLPVGLVFYPRITEDYQFVVLVQEFKISATGGTNTFYLPTYGCNEDKDEPDEDGIYDIDIQLWEKGFNEIFKTLRPKNLATDEEFEVVQEAIYEYTNTQQLTDSLLQALEGLP